MKYGVAASAPNSTVHIMRFGSALTLCGLKAGWTTDNADGWNPCRKCERALGTPWGAADARFASSGKG